MHGTLIGTIGITEKEKRKRPLGFVPEIKRRTGGVRENKSRLRQGWRDQAAPVRVAPALLRWCQRRKNKEQSEKAIFHLRYPISER